MAAMTIPHTFAALRHNEYRAYFFGHAVSVCGTWSQNIALACLVYKLTQSPFLLGFVEFGNLFPLLALSLFTGYIADRVDRKIIVILALTAAAIQAASLSAAAFSGHMTITLIIVASFVNGITNAFEIPARNAMLPHMVAKQDLPNAISLSAALSSIGRIVGSIIAAIAVKNGAECICFAFNAASFLALIVAMSLQKPCRPAPRVHHDWHGDMTAFVHMIRGEPVIARALLLCGITSLFGVQFYMLLPVLAHDRFGGNTGPTGLLFGLVSSGALLAALTLAHQNNAQRARLAVSASTIGVGGFLLIAAVCNHALLTLVLLPVLGYCFMTQNTSIQSVVQSKIPDGMRGKAMSAWATLSIGVIPIGNLLIGTLTTHVGLPISLAVCGGITLVAGVLYVVLDWAHVKELLIVPRAVLQSDP